MEDLNIWLTYRAEDFLMFSEPVYWQMFQTHNALFWPAPVVMLLAGLGVMAVLAMPPVQTGLGRVGVKPGLLVAGVLATSWLLVAFWFLADSYAQINWAAEQLAPLFVVQAILIMLSRNSFAPKHPNPDDQRAGRSGWIGGIGFTLLAHALVGYPLMALLAGRPIAQSEVFGLAPDPTVIATLGVLLIARAGLGRRPILLALSLGLCVLWCGLSWLTLTTLGTWEAWSPAVAAGLAVLGWMLPHRHGTPPQAATP